MEKHATKGQEKQINKASNLQTGVRELMQTGGSQNEIQSASSKYSQICKRAAEANNSLLSILTRELKEKHDTWYKAKIINYDNFITDVYTWMGRADISKPVENINEDEDIDNEISPKNSISNVESKK